MIKKVMTLAAVTCFALGISGAVQAEQKPMDSGKQTKSSSMSQSKQKNPQLRSYGMDYPERWHGSYKRSRHMGVGMNQDAWAYQNLDPEQQKFYRQASEKFLKETLDQRKELAAKKVEMRTLWRMSNTDNERLRELSQEISELRAEIAKARMDYSLSNRKEFGPESGFSNPADYDDENDWWPFW